MTRTSWTPPATVHLSSNDISNVIDGLRSSDRDRALAFLDTVDDAALLYVVACGLTYHRPKVDRPSLRLDAAGYRAFIRAAI